MPPLIYFAISFLEVKSTNSLLSCINPLVLYAPFLCSLETSEKRNVFDVFGGGREMVHFERIGSRGLSTHLKHSIPKLA